MEKFKRNTLILTSLSLLTFFGILYLGSTPIQSYDKVNDKNDNINLDQTDKNIYYLNPNIEFALYNNNELLSITGSGEIDNFEDLSSRPWHQYISTVKQLEFGSGITAIGENAFKDFVNVTDVTFSYSISTINDYAFANCSNLHFINYSSEFPNEITIATNSFEGVQSTGDIHVPQGKATEYECVKVSQLSLWNVLEKTPFISNPQAWWAYSSQSKTLHVDGIGEMDNYNTFAPWYSYADKIDTLHVGPHITKIGKNAFCECRIKTLILGGEVTTIEERAFYLCAWLDSVVIPEKVTTIKSNAFQNCFAIINVYFLGNALTTVDSTAFPMNSDSESPDKFFYIVPGYLDVFNTVMNTFVTGDFVWSVKETKVANPEVDTEPGTSISAIDVKFTIDEADTAVIYYTLDGSEPTQFTGIQYKFGDKIHIDSENNASKEVTIKAISTRKLWTNSDVCSFTYKVLNRVEIPTKPEEVLTYNGSSQTVNIPKSPLYKISGNTQTNAGKYEITLELTDKDNHVWADGTSEDHKIEFTIEKATFDTTAFSFVDKTVEYNKQVQKIEITGTLPAGLSVNYEGNEGTTVSEYRATANFVYDSNNYNYIAPMKATLKIIKRYIDYPTIINPEKVYVYNGSAQTFELSESEYYEIKGNKQTNVGNYIVEVSLLDTDNTIWRGGSNAKTHEYNFNIIKGTYDLSNATFADTSIEYDGNEHTIVYQGTLPNGLTISYEGKGTTVGEYDITATYSGDFTNYNEIAPKTVKLTITPHLVSKPQSDDRIFTYNKKEQTYKITQSDYYTVSNNVQTNADIYYVTYELKDKENTSWEDNTTNNISFPFIIKKATYDISSISLSNKTVEYDGKPHTLEITGTLPKGLTYEPIEGMHTEVGTYDITIKFISDDPNYEPIDNMVATLHILKIGVDKPTLDNTKYVYNGQEQTYNVSSSSLYTVTNNTQTDAGTYDVHITLKDPDHYSWKGDDDNSQALTYKFTINKAIYDMSDITFESEEITYDGKAHQIKIKGTLPDGVSVNYTGQGTNVGVYNISATFSSTEITNQNYEAIAQKQVTLTINPFIVNRPAQDTTSFVYNGKEHTYNIAKSEYYNVLNHSNTRTDAGHYTVQIRLKDQNNYRWDNNTYAVLEYPFVIEKATYDISNITFPNNSFSYDGEIHSLEFVGTLPDGVTVTYENNAQSMPGTYEVTLIFNVDSNHNPIESMTATLSISSAIEELNNNDTSISIDEGFITTISLNSTSLEFREESYSAYIKSDEKLLKVYDIKVLNADGSEYILDPNKTYTLRIKLPDNILEDTDFIVSHIHDASEIHYIRKGSNPAIGAYVIEDGYLVTKINKLSQFLFIEKVASPVQETSFMQYIQTLVLGGFIAFFIIYSIILKHKSFDKWNIICLSILGVSTIITLFFNGGVFGLIINIISGIIILGANIFYSLYSLKFLPLPKKYIAKNETEKEEDIEVIEKAVDSENATIEETIIEASSNEESNVESTENNEVKDDPVLLDKEEVLLNENEVPLIQEENSLSQEESKESVQEEISEKPKKKRTYKKKVSPTEDEQK